MDAAYGNEKTAAQVSDELRTRLAEVERERDTLTRQVKVLREASENMHSFIVVMYGKPDGSVPEIVTTPLGISVKLGQIVAKALAALTSEGAER